MDVWMTDEVRTIPPARVSPIVIVDGVLPAAYWLPGRVWQGVFRPWVLTGCHQLRLAQLEEHQTANLAVAGSTPVPCTKVSVNNRLLRAGRKTGPTNQPKGGGYSQDRPLSCFDKPTAAWKNTLQGADSAVELARQRCVDGFFDGFRGSPPNEGSFKKRLDAD